MSPTKYSFHFPGSIPACLDDADELPNHGVAVEVSYRPNAHGHRRDDLPDIAAVWFGGHADRRQAGPDGCHDGKGGSPVGDSGFPTGLVRAGWLGCHRRDSIGCGLPG